MQIRIGTRRSDLARWQAQKMAQLIISEEPTAEIRMVYIGSLGDSNRRSNLQDIGSVGVFTKSGELALLNHDVDVIVHSLKDLPTILPDPLILAPDLYQGYFSRQANYTSEKMPTRSLKDGSRMRPWFSGAQKTPDGGGKLSMCARYAIPLPCAEKATSFGWRVGIGRQNLWCQAQPQQKPPSINNVRLVAANVDLLRDLLSSQT
jgi:hypothetical protein